MIVFQSHFFSRLMIVGILLFTGVVQAAGEAQFYTSSVHRFRHYQKHLYTLNYSEGIQAGNQYEGVAFNLMPNQIYPAAIALYRCYFSGPADDHFVSTSPTCEGYNNEGLLGFAAPNPFQGSTALHRFYRAQNPDHLITTNYQEGIYAGYQYEGVLGHVVAGNANPNPNPTPNPQPTGYKCTAVDAGMEEHFGGHSAFAQTQYQASTQALNLCRQYHGACRLQSCRLQ